jgi:hypothetical protein
VTAAMLRTTKKLTPSIKVPPQLSKKNFESAQGYEKKKVYQFLILNILIFIFDII